MKILILSFYYPPDLCAGSFRIGALVPALLKSRPDVHIDVYTTMPNRYHSYRAPCKEYEKLQRLTIHRKKVPGHQSAFIDQALAFSSYFFWVFKQVRTQEYDMIIATSSRLFTALLGTLMKSRVCAKHLVLDIRDIFSDTMNSLLPTLPRIVLAPVFKCLERFILKKATCINFVSPAFQNYYKKLLKGKIVTEYTNGIDDCFLNYSFKPVSKTKKLKVLYAGNIGAGQGLIDILPQASQALATECDFLVVGDGGQQKAFQAAIYQLPNLKLQAPVSQKNLPALYDQADILFLHLANCEAFTKVLPSKIFEYAASGKIIVAGVAGVAAELLRTEVPGCYLFQPGDVEALVKILKKLSSEPLDAPDRSIFIQKYARKKIMREWASKILTQNPG